MSRISDALAVLRGQKTAVDNRVPGLIFNAFLAATWAAGKHPSTNQQTNPKPAMDSNTTPSDAPVQTEQHDTAVVRLKKINAYLLGLPALFVGISAALEAARLEAQIGSAERAAYQAEIDGLKAKGDELEGLIGAGAAAVEAADLSDNAVGDTDPVEGDVTGDAGTPNDGAAVGSGPATGDSGAPPADAGAGTQGLESGFDANPADGQ